MRIRRRVLLAGRFYCALSVSLGEVPEGRRGLLRVCREVGGCGGGDVEGAVPYGVGWTYVRTETVMTPPGTSGSENAG